MIRSMTGYGRSEMLSDYCRIAVEIKSVNNRYLDIGNLIPDTYIYVCIRKDFNDETSTIT